VSRVPRPVLETHTGAHPGPRPAPHVFKVRPAHSKQPLACNVASRVEEPGRTVGRTLALTYCAPPWGALEPGQTGCGRDA
jgi:hypothetical protein